MKKSIFIALLICSIGIYAQGRKSLDNDFGINKFKLNSEYELYQSDLKYVWIDKQGTEFYDYVKGDIKTVFEKNVEVINLAFVNNKLYNITIDFGIINDTQKLELLNFLVEKYDVAEILHPDDYRVYVARWETGKTLMHLEEYSCSSPAMDCKTVLFIMSKSLSKLLD